ncbi:hypothetical protein SRHO_G00295040 [Serrasalmus rhombeus]
MWSLGLTAAVTPGTTEESTTGAYGPATRPTSQPNAIDHGLAATLWAADIARAAFKQLPPRQRGQNPSLAMVSSTVLQDKGARGGDDMLRGPQATIVLAVQKEATPP